MLAFTSIATLAGTVLGRRGPRHPRCDRAIVAARRPVAPPASSVLLEAADRHLLSARQFGVAGDLASAIDALMDLEAIAGELMVDFDVDVLPAGRAGR